MNTERCKKESVAGCMTALQVLFFHFLLFSVVRENTFLRRCSSLYISPKNEISDVRKISGFFMISSMLKYLPLSSSRCCIKYTTSDFACNNKTFCKVAPEQLSFICSFISLWYFWIGVPQIRSSFLQQLHLNKVKSCFDVRFNEYDPSQLVFIVEGNAYILIKKQFKIYHMAFHNNIYHTIATDSCS